MPNPYTAGPGDGCMVHAGILTPHGGDKSKAELTSGFPEAAKERFVEDVIKELSGGSPPFPCGDPLPPVSPEMAERLRRDLPNIEIFPDFHKNILGYYLDLARALDNPSEYNLLPVADPVALATSLGGNLKLDGLGDFMVFMIPNPPLLAVKLGIELPKLPSALLELPVPKLPPGIEIPLPELPQLGIGLPSLEIPCLLSMKLSMVLGFPDFMLGLIGGIPQIAFKLITFDIPGALGDVCKMINDAGLFGKNEPQDKNGVSPDTVMQASRRVLGRKMAEMSICHALSKTLGTAPSGLVGLTMKEVGYSPPLGEPADGGTDPESEARDAIKAFLDDSAGTFWSQDPEKYSYAILPLEATNNLKAAIQQCSQASSCGMFARVALGKGGARYFFDYKKSGTGSGKIESYITKSGPWGDLPDGPRALPVSSKPDAPKVIVDWFTDLARGNPVSDLHAIARVRGALILPQLPVEPNGKFYASKEEAKLSSLPSLKRGDVIIVDSLDRWGGRGHVIVVAEDYNEGDSVLYTVEGGGSDPGNKNKASYTKGPPCTGIKPRSYQISQPYKNVAFGSPEPRLMGPTSNPPGWWAMGDGRVVRALINTWKVISGNPYETQGFKQPGSDPVNSKEQGPPVVDAGGEQAIIGDNNDDNEPDQSQPMPGPPPP